MKFAISSCWNSHRHEDGYAMVRELAELGFGYVELSHGIRLSLVPGILKALEAGVARISSVHNFCPLPVGVMGAAPNLYEPSAASRRERILWLHNTRKTIDFANRVGCDRMVIHSGRVRFLFRDPGEAFEDICEANPDQPDLLKAAWDKALKRINRRKAGYLKRLRESFALIAEQARQAGVRIGVENREGVTELPLDSEMETLLESLEEHDVFDYWHDAGHAQLKEGMGLLDHATFLESLRPRLGGFHLHDVSAEGRDHQVPGSGRIDWRMIAGNIRETDTVVMEMSPRLRSEEIRAGRDFLVRTLPGLEEAG
jgi:sugar phosphate isomerase/epimerase